MMLTADQTDPFVAALISAIAYLEILRDNLLDCNENESANLLQLAIESLEMNILSICLKKENKNSENLSSL